MNLLTPWVVLLAAAFRRLLTSLPRTLAAVLALFACSVPASALARSNGFASQGCSGCHAGGKNPTVTITPDLTTFNPGQMLTLTVSISMVNGTPGVGGFFLEASPGGTFKIVDSGTSLNGDGVAHNAPRKGVNGFATFKVGWVAPATPGGVDFVVYANSANGDGSQRGDAGGIAFFSIAYGCTGMKFYHDFDADGFGAESSGYTFNCSAPAGYSAKTGDCNDSDQNVNPGVKEICDGKDNNCDGQIDEGLPFTAYCTDKDGDGHGVSGTDTKMACATSKGFGLCDNDCNDNDPTIYPGATELCNNKDDNCNVQVDEGARTVCGIGWCARTAPGCGSACTPGAPRAEECNDFDDDCDGVKDNGTDLELCKMAGLVCRAGVCVPGNSAGAGGAPANQGGAASGGSLGGASSSAGGSSNNTVATGAEPAGCAFGAGQKTSKPFAVVGLLLGLAALGRRRRRRLVA